MFGKIKTVIVSVVLVALAFGGFSVALAASSTPASAASATSHAASAAATTNAANVLAATAAPTATVASGTQWFGGHITAIGSGNFTVTGPLGGVHVVTVNDQTKYFNRSAQAGGFADLQVGDRVLGAGTATSATGTASSTSQVTAILVIDFGAQTEYRGTGVATGLDASQQSFSFVNRRGQVWEFYVDSNTKIVDRQGNTKAYSDIHVGTRMFVHAEKRADGKWWAVNITLGKTVTPATSTSTGTPS